MLYNITDIVQCGSFLPHQKEGAAGSKFSSRTSFPSNSKWLGRQIGPRYSSATTRVDSDWSQPPGRSL